MQVPEGDLPELLEKDNGVKPYLLSDVIEILFCCNLSQLYL